MSKQNMVGSYQMKRKETIQRYKWPDIWKDVKTTWAIKHMNVSESTYKTGAMCLTFDTNNALNVTLIGLVSLVKLLLNHGFSYILPENM